VLHKLKEYGLIYLASPYRLYPRGPEMAFIDVCRLSSRLIDMGIGIYSPIAHCHAIAHHGKMDPYNSDFWVKFHQTFIIKSDALLVAEMDSWDQSYGVAEEISIFHAANKPRFHINPETLACFQCNYDRG